MYSNAPKKQNYVNLLTSKCYGPQRSATHGRASQLLWDVIRKLRAGYRGEAHPTGQPGATYNTGIPKIFGLLVPHFQNSDCLPIGLFNRTLINNFESLL